MNKIYTALLTVSLFLCMSCTTALIKGPVSQSGKAWDVSILKLETGMKKIKNDGTMSVAENYNDQNSPIKGYYDYSSSDSGFGRGRSFKSGRVTVSVRVKTTFTEMTYIPKYETDTLMYMEIRVQNRTKSTREFNFKRVRLLFDESVACPYILLTPELFPKSKSFAVTVKPGKRVTRQLVFVHKKGTKPYRVVYDNCKNGKIVDKISFPLDAAQSK